MICQLLRKVRERAMLTVRIDFLHVRLEDEAALDDLGEDVVCLYGVKGRVCSIRGSGTHEVQAS